MGALGGLFGPGGIGGAATAGGGVTPEEAAYAQYEGAEDMVKQADFFSKGMGHSTMDTQGVRGGGALQALIASNISQENAARQQRLINANLDTFGSGLSKLLAGLGNLGSGSTG